MTFLPENITFDKALEQYRAFRNEYDKKSINSVFNSILKHSYKQNEDGTITISVEDSSSFLDILLHPSFSFYLGSFEYDSEDFKFDQWGISSGNVTLKDSSGKELKGKIVVTNQAENETDVIIAVYAKPEGEDSYSLYWSSADGAGYMQDAYFYIECGNYDVRVYVRKQTAIFPYYTEAYFETGYKNPVKVEEDEYSFIYYDGKGIYQK